MTLVLRLANPFPTRSVYSLHFHFNFLVVIVGNKFMVKLT